jgi:type I restriction enzyme R subunit
LLSNIIKSLNETYGVNLTEDDRVDIGRMKEKLESHEGLKEAANSDNTMENIRYKFNKTVDELLLEFVHTKLDLYKKLSDEKVNKHLKEKWFQGYMDQFRRAS